MRGYSGSSRRRPSGLIIVGALAAAVLVFGMLYAGVTALIGSDGESAPTTTLPPLTTTSTSLAPTTTTEPRTYEVQSGDTLSSIAAKFEVEMQAIMDLNGITDPDLVPAGQVLTIPPTKTGGGGGGGRKTTTTAP